MKHIIYLIKATDEASQPYDSYDSHVVIADTPKQARKMCPAADEGTDCWINPITSTIKIIGYSNLGKGVVLSSFRAG